MKQLNSLKKDKGFIKYFKNTSWLFLDKIFKFISIIIIGSFVAKYLGPKDFGVLNYAISFVVIFSPLSLLGLDSIVIKNLVQNKNEAYKVLGTAFSLKLIGGIVMIMVLFIITKFFFNDNSTSIYIIIIASASIFQSFNVIDFFFQSRVLSKFIAFSNIFMLVLSSTIKILLIIYKAPLLSFVYVILLESMFMTLALMYFYFKNNFKILLWKFDFHLLKKLLSNSWPLMLSGIFITMYMRIDQIMIEAMLDVEFVGKYAAAVRLSEAWYFVPMVLASSLFPAIINSKKKSIELYYKRMQSFFNLMSGIAITLAFIMTFMSNWLISFLYGNEYEESSIILKIHIWSSIFVFLGVAGTRWFVVENLQKIHFRRSLIGLIINVFGNFFLIKKWGMEGAAISSLLSQIIVSYIFDFFNKKTRVLFYMKTKSFLFIKGNMIFDK